MSTINASSSARYWCHHCGRQVPIYMAPDPTCQRCNEQFIEEMDGSADDPQSFLDDTLGDNDNDDDDDIFQFFRRSMGSNSNNDNNITSIEEAGATGEEDTLETMLQNALSNLLASGNGDRNRSGNNNTSNARSEGRPPVYFYTSAMDGNLHISPISSQQSNGAPTSDTSRVYLEVRDEEEEDDNDGEERRRSNRNNDNFQGLLRAIATLSGVETIGNPNDYAFSETALDNIITQLMEQTGGHTAPPPAPDDVIAALPKRPLSEKEFNNQIDCSVCKEDFVLEESVIELPCMHLYHDDCINPWLKVNGTCPVCRHPVEPSQDDDNNTERNPTDTTPQQPDTITTTTTATLQLPSRNPTPSAASAAFAWMTRSSPPLSSWPSSMTGSTFTWGLGGRYRSQSTESDDESVDLLIDLD